MKSHPALVRFVTFAIVLLMVASLFIGGAQPQAVGLFPAPWDKLAHLVFFFVMAFLLATVIRLPFAFVFLTVVFVGVCDEIHQSYLPGRHAGLDDLIADAVGALLGVLVFKLMKKFGWFE